jgi:DNA repair protein RadA/Sms
MGTTKQKYNYVCNECGYLAYQWLGKCPDCGQWNTFAEQAQSKGIGKPANPTVTSVLTVDDLNKLKTLDAISGTGNERFSVGSGEFDRVLGGGLFKGSTVLLAGEPGIGKSTLLLSAGIHLANTCAEAGPGAERAVFYISAEEAEEHIKKRAKRLSLSSEHFFILSETDVNRVVAYLEKYRPLVVIIDSIQALYNPDIETPPGTLTQVRECGVRLCHYAREYGIALFLVGHVTKEGLLAGPKSLEHLVDTVIYFEGDRHDEFRLLRAVKNRHGATGEIGIFEMSEKGLTEVQNPSQYFLSKDTENLPGRATVALMEGRRPFLVEVQALANETFYNNPLRRCLGVEVNRVSLLLAVLEKTLHLNFSKFDLFVKSAGAISVGDPAADLAIAAAILSSLKQQPLDGDAVFIGEIGLGGEIRKTKLVQARVKEADRLGYRTAYVPRSNEKEIRDVAINVVYVKNLAELFSALFSRKTKKGGE